MDDNVMKKYTIIPTEASHHLMYDQGTTIYSNSNTLTSGIVVVVVDISN